MVYFPAIKNKKHKDYEATWKIQYQLILRYKGKIQMCAYTIITRTSHVCEQRLERDKVFKLLMDRQ